MDLKAFDLQISSRDNANSYKLKQMRRLQFIIIKKMIAYI